jgi:hypothetical protein
MRREVRFLEAAKAAADVGAFGLATEILDRADIQLCVICFGHLTGHHINFGGQRVRVCEVCREDDRRGPTYRSYSNTFGDEGTVLWITRNGETYYGS